VIRFKRCKKQIRQRRRLNNGTWTARPVRFHDRTEATSAAGCGRHGALLDSARVEGREAVLRGRGPADANRRGGALMWESIASGSGTTRLWL
jgi:hypothetical protein